MTSTLAAKRAFTLIEALAAAAVLSLLVLILTQVISLTGQAITVNTKSLDVAGQARLVFDRMGADFAGRPARNDLGVIFTKVATGSDCFRFYTQATGYTGARGMSAVGFRIQTATAGRLYQLERGAAGTDWPAGSTGLQFLPLVLSAANVTSEDNPDTDYEVLAPGVFRLEFCYLLTTGKLSISNPNTSPTDLSGIAAVVIAIGAIDSKSLLQLTNPSSQLSALSSALVKATEGNDPLFAWSTALSSGFTVNGVPKPVLQNVHVYERTFYLQ